MDVSTSAQRTAKLSLVDLAGSERVCRSHCVGETLEEAKKINASLTALGKVIDALVERRTHVPYRDSTLTRVLEEALGGNSRTTLLVTASACSQYLDETVCSLRFAARAQKVRNSAHVNFVYSAEELWPLVAQLQKDLAQARRELHASKLLVPRRCSTASIAKFRRDSNSTEAESKEELILQVPKDPKAAAPDASWSSGMSRLSTVSAESPRSESSPSAPSDLRCLEDEEGTPMLRPLPNIWQGKGTASDVLQVALETVRTLEQVLLSQEEALEKAKLLRPEVLGAPGDRLSSPSSPLEGIGRFGIFGMEPLKGHVKICDLGCCLVLVSFILMVFVEEGDRVDANAVDASVDSAAAMSELPRHHSTASAVQEDQVLREKYSRWRDDHVSGRRRSSVMEAAGTVLVSYSTAETGGHLHSVGGFSVLQPPRLVPLRDDETPSDGAGPDVGPEADHAERQVSPGAVSRQSSQVQSFLQAASGEPSSLAGRAWRKAAGVVLALLAGSLTGVQSVPASLVNQRHKDAPATNVVFPQCLGIYICSSAIYLIYSAAAKLAGWRVPHSPIRPAYLSGCVWAVGFTFMITGISSLGFSIGYTLDAVGPIVIASLLSIFVFKEITDRHQLILYGIAFTLQVVGVICMSSASS